MRVYVVVAAAGAAMLFAANAFAQETCLRPKWTECVQFPNGGRHTGIDPNGKSVELEIPPASEICVRNEWEIQAETYAQFSRNGVPWPNPDWDVHVDNFCLYKN